ncbi:MAG TPA: ATP-binding cassette domain-containing protein, partial [Anaerolineaceae bacterium]
MTHTLNADTSQARTARLGSPGVTLEAHRVVVRASKTAAPLQDISLYIPPRSLVALAGPDGAGKTTLLETLAALRHPDSGQVLLDAASLYTFRKAFLPWIGYVSTLNTLHPTLTVLENLATAA